MPKIIIKKIKLVVQIILITVIIASLTSCGTVEKKRYEGEFLQLFDTMTRIVAYMDNKEDFTKLSTMIHDDLYEYHKLYDIYNSYDGINNIKTINDNAGKQPVIVNRKIIDLLLFSKSIYTETEGKCNIALGSVLEIWHKYREAGIDNPENAVLPPMKDLKDAALHTDIDKIIIDENASTVYLQDPLMRLDVGAVAKGYATEQVCQDAMAQGYDSALISVGGNVRAIGYKMNEELWNVGIQNPDLNGESANLLVTVINDKSVVTSGIYERYYTVDGITYHHIIDPETLMPSTNYKSVSIICMNSGKADALSTAIFNMTYEVGLKYIESQTSTEALWVFLDGTVKYSSGFQKYVKK